MVTAFTSIYDELTAAGHQPKHHVLDNKCSRAVHHYLDRNGVTRQNIEAHNYKINASEPAVKAPKYHIIATVATLNAHFLIQVWHRMIPQILTRYPQNALDLTAE